MKHFYENTVGENWFDYQKFYSYIVKNSIENAHFVEIGSWKGRSTCYMAVEIINSNKKIKFDCVDTWVVGSDVKWAVEHELGEDIFQIFNKNIEPVKSIVNPIRSLSWEASKYYDNESLDFVFIDASHDYISVKKDIESWNDKIKTGGIISGHDYFSSHDVKKAVDEFYKDKNIEIYDGCWLIRK